jgi:hypothetical protein
MQYFSYNLLTKLSFQTSSSRKTRSLSFLFASTSFPFEVSSFFVCSILRVNIVISAYVEAYLEKTFYNLTTLALHNWRTYGEMRALAKHKFQTETGDDLLPPQTLEQV